MTMNQAYGHMLHDFYLRQLRELDAKRKQRLAALRTKEEAEAYVADVRKRIIAAFGKRPPKTPLNARTIGTIRKDGFIIEKVVFESRPGLPVTGLLYLPEKINGKVPGVLGICGHSGNGKAFSEYQPLCQGLVMKGFAVFMYDPISQGERLQFSDVPDSDGIAGICTREHNMLGKQLRLCGENFALWRAWDGIRALDYLLARPEVDASHVGVTGTSGGGTLTSYINVLDDRPTMVAPSCFITTYLRNYQNEVPCDSEQVLPGIIAAECDMADLIIARAPRPVIIMGQGNDFFDHRGTIDSYEQAKRIYSLLGAGENIALKIGPDSHGYSLVHRESMYEFFSRHVGVAVNSKELAGLSLLSNEEAQCAPGGQVENIKGTRKVGDFIRDKAQKLTDSRIPIKAEELRGKIVTALRILEIDLNSPVNDFHVLRPGRIQDEDTGTQTFINSFAFETEPGIKCVMKNLSQNALFNLPANLDNVWLYVPHLDAGTELLNGIRELDLCGITFGLDIRGVGELRPISCGREDDYFDSYGTDYFYASYGIMLDNPYLGGKVKDVLRTVSLLKSRGCHKVNIVGRGLGSIVATFATLVSDDISSVKLINAPVSWHEVIRKGIGKWPLSHMLPGMLEYCDLPDIYRLLCHRELEFYNCWDSMFRVIKKSEIKMITKQTKLPEQLFKIVELPEITKAAPDVVYVGY